MIGIKLPRSTRSGGHPPRLLPRCRPRRCVLEDLPRRQRRSVCQPNDPPGTGCGYRLVDGSGPVTVIKHDFDDTASANPTRDLSSYMPWAWRGLEHVHGLRQPAAALLPKLINLHIGTTNGTTCLQRRRRFRHALERVRQDQDRLLRQGRAERRDRQRLPDPLGQRLLRPLAAGELRDVGGLPRRLQRDALGG